MSDEQTAKITFKVDEELKIRDFMRAESSFFSGVELMARFAYGPDGQKMTFEEVSAIAGDMTELEYYTLYMQFRNAAVPKTNGRR
jgi:hypothetical protein